MIIYIICCLLLICIACIACYSKTITRKYEVFSDKITSEVRIVFVSDLHSVYQKNNFEKLLCRIYETSPHIVVLGGDIFDAKRKNDGALAFLKSLKKDILTFYVTGNHEFRRGDIDEIVDAVEKSGICVLNAESRKVLIEKNSLLICGIFDEHTYGSEKKAEKSLKDVIIEKFSKNGSDFNVLVAHNPFFIDEYLNGNFDLIISGHTHGGQVRIPYILNGLYSRHAGFFPPYCGGKYEHNDNVVHIVGRGVSSNPRWFPRIFNRKEVVLITLKPKTEKNNKRK